MQNFSVVHGAVLDNTTITDWVTAIQITARNTVLGALTATNKGSACWIQLHDSASGAGSTYQSYYLPANGTLSVLNMVFGAGLYVRAVTTANGSTAISSSDVKLVANYVYHPVSA